MIGVISKPREREVIEEFFQLFKTPWEFYTPDKRYEVLLVTAADIPHGEGSLIIVYGTEKYSLDEFEAVDIKMQSPDVFIGWGKEILPLYGKAITFIGNNRPLLFCSRTKQTIGYETRKGDQRILRVGYNLFDEILYLLSVGQPSYNASIPTLDLHIEMLRNWIVETGVPLVEIPPIPEGYRFCTCLTHDIDFIGIRPHFFDHSMWGFLYRATLGSFLSVVKGKMTMPKLLRNFQAACSLPLVFLGMSPDPWDQFDRCLEIENGFRSTFFFIPFKNRAGKGFSDGQAKRRAVKYDIKDVGSIVRKLLAQGCEIGVHGIDAWNNIESGEQELQRIQLETVSQAGIGIRMHWLCRNEQTFEILDKAGYSYDSTFGFNKTVGFRAGTSQPFMPIGTTRLLELPLHIQDTALFRKGGLNTSEAQADEICQQIIEHVKSYGGVLTVLWHQRSLGPERLWGNFYERLIKKLQDKNTWFATANEIVEWFRIRRSARFETYGSGTGDVRIKLDEKKREGLPPLIMHNYRREKSSVFEIQSVDA